MWEQAIQGLYEVKEFYMINEYVNRVDPDLDDDESLALRAAAQEYWNQLYATSQRSY